MRFFVGLHMISQAWRFPDAFISVNRLRDRKSDFSVNSWIMDSGAFTEVTTYGGYRYDIAEYSAQIRRWAVCGTLLAAVAQDYMCEPFVLEKTGLTVADHQRLTIERYDALLSQDTAGVYIMPVLQGWGPVDYVSHIRQYGNRLKPGMWVGVGSVCKRNANPNAIRAVLHSIKCERPDLRLHGFGLKTTALRDHVIREKLFSADSMAWSFAARREGRDANSYHEAADFYDRITGAAVGALL